MFPYFVLLYNDTKKDFPSNVSVCGCYSFSEPYNELATSPGGTLPSPSVRWDRLQPPHDPL